MAVMRNSITFGGVNSADYGIYIGGEGVFNAPERDVEMVSIPGRNGSFALDKGRFENITVKYSAFNFEPDLATFKANLDAFRNALCAQEGYQRLTDTFHTDEYRMATFISGLDIKPINYNTAAKFDIVFDCKPQRFLTSGETKRSVSSGSSITNPTLFPASPLIECKGQGTIYIGGVPIVVSSVPIGDILLSNGAPFSKSNMTAAQTAEMAKITLDVSNLNTGDNIHVSESNITYSVSLTSGLTFSGVVVELESGESWSTKCAISTPTSAYFRTTVPAQNFKKGTAATKTYRYTQTWTAESGYVSSSRPIVIQLKYDGANTITFSATTVSNEATYTYAISGAIGQVNGYSTIIVNNTFYIDLEIGEAYFNSGSSYTSANYAVQIPPKLPTLRPGASVITYSNTITNFKITPRWWKI